jgi:hypothetical protein
VEYSRKERKEKKRTMGITVEYDIQIAFLYSEKGM